MHHSAGILCHDKDPLEICLILLLVMPYHFVLYTPFSVSFPVIIVSVDPY